MFLQFFCNLGELFMHRFGHHFRVSLRLANVGVAKHPRDILNLGPIAEHPGGEGVTGEV